MKGSRTLALLCLLGWGAWGCGSAKTTASFSQPAKPPAPVVAKAPVSEVDLTITSAKERFFQGERELNLGHLEKAKEEFNASLDILMSYQASNAPNQQIEAVIDDRSHGIPVLFTREKL